jgi:CubicO group peptidase (beta-lactamase class C family)
MKTESIFHVMSITKPVTCAGIMALVDEGRLSLLDPVEKLVPEFKDIKVNPCSNRVGHNCELVPPRRPMNVLDLMTRRSGWATAGTRRPDRATSVPHGDGRVARVTRHPAVSARLGVEL